MKDIIDDINHMVVFFTKKKKKKQTNTISLKHRSVQKDHGLLFFCFVLFCFVCFFDGHAIQWKFLSSVSGASDPTKGL